MISSTLKYKWLTLKLNQKISIVSLLLILLLIPLSIFATLTPTNLFQRAVSVSSVPITPTAIISNLPQIFTENDGHPLTPNFGAYIIKPVGNKLYIGVSADRPMQADGSLLVRYENGVASAILNTVAGDTKHNPITEQGIHEIIEVNGKLYIAGTDPTDTPAETQWDLGNTYTYREGEQIIKHRNLPNVIHSLSLLSYNNKVYTSTGSWDGNTPNYKTFGEIYTTNNEGESWEKIATTSSSRAYNLTDYNGDLYVADGSILEKSLDKGINWQIISNLSVSPFTRFVIFKNKLFGILYNNYQTFFSINTEGAVERYPITGNVATSSFHNILTIDNSNYLYHINVNNQILRTDNLVDWYLVSEIPTTNKLASLIFWPATNSLIVAEASLEGKIWQIDLSQTANLPIVTPAPTNTPIPTITPIPPPPTPTIFQPVISKDGKIIFGSNGNISFFNPDGSNVQTFYTSSETGYSASYPNFSSDGSKVVFVSKKSAYPNTLYGIMMKDYLNGEITEILPAQPVGAIIAWTIISPDKQFVYYSLAKESDYYRIYRIKIGQTQQEPIITDSRSSGKYIMGDISYDGQKIVYTDNANIFTANADGTNQQNITNASGQNLYPVFSPNGTSIIYSAKGYKYPQLYKLNLADGTKIRLTPDSEYYEYSPSFSPDGKKIVYNASLSGKSEANIIPAEGGMPVKIYEFTNTALWQHSWAPDLRYLQLPTPTPTPVEGICQCDLWAVVENQCSSLYQAVCTDKFSCICSLPTPTPTVTPTPTPIAGTFCTSLYQIVSNQSSYLKTCSDSQYNKIADLNKDKVINGADFSLWTTNKSDEAWCNRMLSDTTDPCFVPTPTPTKINHPPVITTTTLPTAHYLRYYSGRIAGYDLNKTNSLTMKITGLPPKLFYRCTSSTATYQKNINCNLNGFPTARGNYTINVTLSDNKGGTTSKTLPLVVK